MKEKKENQKEREREREREREGGKKSMEERRSKSERGKQTGILWRRRVGEWERVTFLLLPN